MGKRQDAYASAHPLLAALHKEAKGFSWDSKLKDLDATDAIYKADPETQRDVLMSAIALTGRQERHCTGTPLARTRLITGLIQKKIGLDEKELIQLLKWSAMDSDCTDAGYVIKAVGRYLSDHDLSTKMRKALSRYSEQIAGASYRSSAQRTKYRQQIAELLGEDAAEVINVDEKEPWAARLLADLGELDDKLQKAVRTLVASVSKVSGSKPSAKWIKEVATHRESISDAVLRTHLCDWMSAFDQPRDQPPKGGYYERSVWEVADINSDLMKGLIWLSPQLADKKVIRCIASVGLSGQKKIPGVGPRSSKVTNAAVWALGQINDELAIGQLAILRAKIKNKAVQKVIDKSMQTIADRIGVSPEEVEEMSVPTYGLTEVGRAREPLGDFAAELIVTGTSTTELRWIKPDGKPQKTVPKAVKDNYADELKDLKAAAKDIKKMLPVQRDRIDRMFLEQKTWAYETWSERYLDHPLVGTLARRLIWVFDHGGSKAKVEATWLDGKLVDVQGNAVKINADSVIVSMWHPIGRSESQINAWRQFFVQHEIKQPFKQAHREVYLLTDAERSTNVYSNRYASHILKQHQYNALCAARGWRNALRLMVDDEVPASSRSMPAYGLRAEFWVEGAGEEYGQDTNETGTYLYLATDQVRFYPIDAAENWGHATGGGFGPSNWHGANNANATDPIPLDQIDPLAFSEVMRDVDLFVGVASVGNDPNWQDGGPEGRYRDYWESYSFGDLGATAQTRKTILKRLVPRLKIADRCSFDEKFLIVRGDKRTYKIHLGSSNILMEPNDQYLCIVPGRGDGKVGDKVFLPFEGDQRLAVILSKAMMLAEDTKIKDATILSQIGR
jgi:hypothetical protein